MGCMMTSEDKVERHHLGIRLSLRPSLADARGIRLAGLRVAARPQACAVPERLSSSALRVS
jgi:hypothetical protein